jgi:hypothetical protein
VEDIVDLGAWGQLKTDSNLVDEFPDTVRPKILGLKLPFDSDGQGRHWTLTKPKKNPVPNGIHHLPVGLVVDALLDGLGLLQAITDVLQENSAISHGLGDCSHAGVTGFI